MTIGESERGKSKATDNTPTPPLGWGADSLSEYMDDTYRNRWATFVRKKDWFLRMSRIDQCFVDLEPYWTKPKSMITPFLFGHAHCAYRAACEHAAGGQVADVYPAARVCLEYAGYALHISQNQSLCELWLRRDEDAITRNAVKREFLIAKVKATIESVDRTTAKRFDRLYQRAIDCGAHPNELGVTSALAIKDTPAGKQIHQTQLHGDGLPLDHALSTTVATGMCALEILQNVFPEKFEILGVRAKLLQLRRGL